MKKTNAMRRLDAMKAHYEVRSYEFDPEDLSGVHAAKALGLDEAIVFKTLVAVGDKTGPVVFVIPVARSLDMKRAAAASGNKRIEMIPPKDLMAVTGYLRGGCSPIGMKKAFPTFIDKLALECACISVSAGQRGLQILIEPGALMALTSGVQADIVR